MKLTESINRGFNLLASVILSLTGIAFASEIFLENDLGDKMDDIGLLVLAVIAIVWYLTKNHKYTRSFVPVLFILLGLLDKIIAMAVEFRDKEAAGDDLGGIILFAAATIIVLYQYSKTKKLLAEAGQQ